MATASEKFELLISRGKHLSHDQGLSRLFSTENVLEETFCQEKLQKGISFFNRNFFSMIVSMMTGVLTLTYFNTIARVFDATNKSNFRHYLSTLSHVLDWYRDLPSLMKSSSKRR